MPTLAVVPQASNMIETSLQLRAPEGAPLAPASVIAPIGGLNEACSGAPALLPALHAPTPRATSEPSLAATFSVDSTQLPEIGAVRGASEKQVSGLLVPPASLAPLPSCSPPLHACVCPWYAQLASSRAGWSCRRPAVSNGGWGHPALARRSPCMRNSMHISHPVQAKIALALLPCIAADPPTLCSTLQAPAPAAPALAPLPAAGLRLGPTPPRARPRKPVAVACSPTASSAPARSAFRPSPASTPRGASPGAAAGALLAGDASLPRRRCVLVAKQLTNSDAGSGRIILPRVAVESNLSFVLGYRHYALAVRDCNGEQGQPGPSLRRVYAKYQLLTAWHGGPCAVHLRICCCSSC